MKTIDDIISNNSTLFIEEITWLLNNRRGLKPSLDFPIFSSKNDENFVEQSFFSQRVFEKTRDILVIKTIKDFFDFFGIECECNPSQQKTFHILGSVKNDFDRNNDFVFKTKDAIYRFSHSYPRELENYESPANEIKKKYGVKNLYRIRFEEDTNQFFANDISLKDFFAKYFSNALFEKYIASVKSILQKANEMIGFSTIKSLSSWKVLEELKEDLSLKIRNYDYGSGYLFENNQVATFSNNDYSQMEKAFLENKAYGLLLSELDFSKCFMTSEYLYLTIKKQNHFDYSSIVFGYFKAIELLVSYILNIKGQDEIITIKRFAKKYELGNKDIKLETFYNGEKYYSKAMKGKKITLNQKIDALLLDTKLHSISIDGINTTYNVLSNYRKTCRNGYTHVDTIFSLDEVDRIRHNTWVCLFYLIGGFVLPKIDGVAIFNYRYSKLYKILKANGWTIHRFIAKINGEDKNLIWNYQNSTANMEYDIKTGTVSTPLAFFCR